MRAFACLLLLASSARAAPVPTHLMPPSAAAPVPNSPGVPGFRWWYLEYELEVVGIVRGFPDDPPDVIYKCVSHPGRTWQRVIGCEGLSRQTLGRTWEEVNTQVVQPTLVMDTYQPFTLVPP